MRGFLKLLGWLFAIGIVASPLILAALILEKHPLVVSNSPILLGDVVDAKALKERYDPRQMSPNVTTLVSANERELNTALSSGLTALPRARAQITIDGTSVDLWASADMPIPQTPFGRYINLKVSVGPSSTGFEVTSLTIGHLPIPPGLVKPVLAFVIDQVVGPGKGAQMLASIKSLRVSGKTVTIAFRPPPTLVTDIKYAAKRAIEVAGMQTIRAYYSKLVDIGLALGYDKHVSLAQFIGPSFELAKSRSAFGNPIEENRALILALAIYFGDDHFERLLSDVKSGGLENIHPSIEHVYLQNRNDWVQHFITSAGLQVAGGTGFANEIGEAKELSDSQGSEGFSFGDLAADHTGVRLAEIAVASDASARRLQDALANTSSEGVFFPKVTDFPEDLPEAEFRAKYGDVGSAAYRKQVKAIDDRIAQIPLYK